MIDITEIIQFGRLELCLIYVYKNAKFERESAKQRIIEKPKRQ